MSTNHQLNPNFDRIQKNAVSRAIEALEESGKALIVMTTGSGKTRIGCKIIDKLDSQRVLWITQHIELISQTGSDIDQYFNAKVCGLFHSSSKNTENRVTIASVQSLHRDYNLKLFNPKEFDIVIVDEAHHSRASTWSKAIEYFKAPRLGLTATPIRSDGQGLEDLFGGWAFNLDYREAQNLGLIAKEKYRVILTNSKINGLVTRSGDYKPQDLDRLVISKNRNRIILEAYKKYGRGLMKEMGLKPKTICFCINVSHAFRMKEMFKKSGIKAEVLLGKPSILSPFYGQHQLSAAFRNETYKTFLETERIEVLCCVNILNEGKNIPDVACLLLCRPTRSQIIFQQQIGRGCRLIPAVKKEFLVLDFVDMMNMRHPPSTLSKVIKVPYYPEEIIADYYKGKDPKIVDKMIDYLAPDYKYENPHFWTEERALKTILAFYKKEGRICVDDLLPTRTGLPSRNTIIHLFGSVKECFLSLGIPFRAKHEPLDKEFIRKQILDFYQKMGKVVITDLGQKNHLPSQKAVQNHWGSWSKFCIENNIYTHQAPHSYKEKFNKTFKSNWTKAKRALPVGVWKKGNLFYVDIYRDSKRIRRKGFKTVDEAVEFRNSMPHRKKN